ncbi:MAG: formyltransferase family protein [Thermoanaerobaculia bacterium]
MRVLISTSGGGSFARFARASPVLADLSIEIADDSPAGREVPWEVDHHLPYSRSGTFWHDFLSLARSYDLVFLNSRRILPAEVVRPLRGRVINHHPSLLPAFPGLDPWARILAAGCTMTGATFHFVTEEVDAGPIICQTVWPVTPSDTAESLSKKHWLHGRAAYLQVLRWFADERVVVDFSTGRVTVRDARYEPASTVPNLEISAP